MAEAHADDVVLLHGLGRTRLSMIVLRWRLRRAGFRAVSMGYPSRQRPIGDLAEHVRARLPVPEDGASLHFVTHSLGGIIVRRMLSERRPPGLGRVVMLSPPNAGSRLAGQVRRYAPFRAVLGPALDQLASDGDSVPERLGPVDFDLGVIMGDRTLPGMNKVLDAPNDGIVTVEEGRVRGMSDFVVVRSGHTFMMNSRDVARQVVHFLRHGRFEHAG